ncbi:Kinase, NEK [Giardia muris]|uniref:non-specific serine/threonine protein kinase n=1 Tax=Giardia muris TaxID=5742 RepID=A0A4Z1T684_GIAMU|nr:Kinase, NEK [Giardia muris]TNJ28647.1 Kinase, NEK [Giardia muris]|eukprot:TNJ28644.1 Kinase, NEK [Giardia muris]
MSFTELMKAVKSGDLESVKANLGDAGKKDEYGQTALIYATKWNHANCIPLLENEIGMQDNDGLTALMYAAYNGNADCARLLLSEAGKQATKNSEFTLNGKAVTFPPGTTALILAAHFNHPEIVELLLPYEQGMEDSKGYTAQWYTNNGDLGEDDFTSVCELLKNEGTERIHPPSNLGEVLRLQEHLSKLTTENETLKMELADQKAQNLALEKEIARLREESLISSAIRGDIEGIRRRLSQVKWHDASGMTALMHAASRGQTEVVRLLRPLEARLQDGRGWTALMHAVGGGHEECAGLLLLERDLKDGEGRTAAEHAVDEKMRQVLMHQPSFPRLPDSLSGYHLTAVLGKGAFGAVYTAHGNGQNVAVKVIDLGKYNEKGRELLRREAEILLSLDHPNILQCLGTGENDDDDTYIIVTELCCGDLRGEMKERKKTGRSYTNQEVWKMVREMAAALVYLHRKRHVHRDLKPENIFITSNGRCVLGDFGLTKVLEDSSQMGTCVGTLAYMAPEIHRKESYDKSVDVWALGVAAYEMCTGDRPFKDPAVILEKKPAPPLRGRPSELADLIAWMLSKNPKDRPTAQEVIKEAERNKQAD